MALEEPVPGISPRVGARGSAADAGPSNAKRVQATAPDDDADEAVDNDRVRRTLLAGTQLEVYKGASEGMRIVIVACDPNAYCQHPPRARGILGVCCHDCSSDKYLVGSKDHGFRFQLLDIGTLPDKPGADPAVMARLQEAIDMRTIFSPESYIALATKDNLYSLQYANVRIVPAARQLHDDEVVPSDCMLIDASAGDTATTVFELIAAPNGIYVRAGLGPPCTPESDEYRLEARAKMYLLLSHMQKCVRRAAHAELEAIARDCHRIAVAGNIYDPQWHRTEHSTAYLMRRAAVILAEDACAPADTARILEFFALALLIRRNPSFIPSKRAVRRVAQTLQNAVGSASKPVPMDLRPEQWRACVRMQEIIGGMSGDKQMFRDLADKASIGTVVRRTGWADNRARLPGAFPLALALDGHVNSGVMLAVEPPSTGVYTVADARADLWNKHGALNGRTDAVALVAGCPPHLAKAMRYAYRLLFRQYDSVERTAMPGPRPVVYKRPTTSGYGRGALAAILAVGDVEVTVGRRTFRCSVGGPTGAGVNDPDSPDRSERVAVKPPPRAPRNSSIEATPDETARCIDQLRAKVHSFSTPYMRGTMRWAGDRWMLEESEPADVAIHPPLAMPASWDAVLDAAPGVGIAENAQAMLPRILGALPLPALAILRRAVRGCHATVEITAPERDGSGAYSQYGGYAYRSLCMLAMYYPGALWPQTLTRFRVASPLCLRELEDSIAEFARGKATQQPVDETTEAADNEQTRAQNALIAMVARSLNACGVAGVAANMGFGKTRVAAEVIRRARPPNGVVLYVTMPSLIKSTITELATRRCAAVHAKQAKEMHRGSPTAYVWSFDTLKNRIAEIVPFIDEHSVLIFDEADKLFGESKRRAEMLNLAAMAGRVVFMTGTMVSDADGLLDWLSLACNGPVSKRNMQTALGLLTWGEYRINCEVVYAPPVVLPISARVADVVRREGRGANWNVVATAVYEDVDVELANVAMRVGPCAVLARSMEHGARLVDLLNARRYGCAALCGQEDPGTPYVVLVLSTHSRGLNFFVRFGALVMSTYPGSTATYQQLMARFVRPGQKRTQFVVHRVGMVGMLELLADKHASRQLTAEAIAASVAKFVVQERAPVPARSVMYEVVDLAGDEEDE